MDPSPSITLKRGDLITIPGVGTKQIGSIDQVSHERYLIRLDEKFVESTTLDIVVNDRPSAL